LQRCCSQTAPLWHLFPVVVSSEFHNYLQTKGLQISEIQRVFPSIFFRFSNTQATQSLLLSIFITFLFGNQTTEHSRKTRQRNTTSKDRLGMKRATLAALPPIAAMYFPPNRNGTRKPKRPVANSMELQ